MDYLALVNDNSRPTDNYINATKWCATFDKLWYDFSRLPARLRPHIPSVYKR